MLPTMPTLVPWLWKAAVEKAGSFDIDKIKAVNGSGIEMTNAPEGYVRIHETNNHLYSKLRVGRARADGQFDVVL